MANHPLSESMTPDEMRDVLESRGYRLLGEGNFSAVYAKEGERTVLKIGDNDDDWAVYARLCRANQDNPHFPRIERVGAMRGFLIARMERLSPVNAQTFLKENLPMLCYISTYISQSLRTRTTHWEYANILQQFNRTFPDKRGNQIALMTYVNEQAMRCPRPLAQALNRLHTLKVAGKLEFDFKPDNFMQRDDGTLVLTDPIYSQA